MTGTTMTVITTATILANLAVMVALWKARRAPSHYPLMSLVMADLMVGIAVQPLAAARELFVFKLHRGMCACWSILDVLGCTASILSLCALGWERWSGITAPLARAKRARRARILAILVWPVATLVALPAAFIPSPKHFHPGELEKACIVNVNTWYVFFSITFSFYLPACVIVTMYVFILRALSTPPSIRVHRGRTPCPVEVNNMTTNTEHTKPTVAPNTIEKRDNNQNLTVNSPQRQRGCYLNGTVTACTAPVTGKCSVQVGFLQRQRRATRIIVMLMALFLVCWTPYFIILPLDSLYDNIWDTTWLWCTWLGYVNSALNPFVYAATSPSVRRALHSSLTISSSRNNEMPLTSRVKRS